MLSQQFEDIPQIQYTDEARFYSWSSNCHGYPYADKHQPAGFSVVEDTLCMDDFDNGMLSMQRFMFDPSPQSHGLLHANIPLQSQYPQQYVSPWPSSGCRNASPDRTSVSGTSSYASQNEASSPYAYSTISYGNPIDFQPSLPYDTNEHLADVICMSGNSGTSISLKEIEYAHHELEPTTEDADTVDVKLEPTMDSEQASFKTEADPSEYREYTDSGIGNSVRDAESVQPVDFKHESDEDSEYSPRNRAGKRKRSAPHARTPKRRNGSRKDSVVSIPRSNKPGRKPRGTQ